MRELAFIVPGRLATLTGGYGYDRRIVEELSARGWRVTVHELPDGFPHPSADARADAARVLRRLADGALVLIDGLAGGALPSETEAEASRLRLVALVHHPLAHETGLDESTAAALEASERHTLACMRGVIVTSPRTAAALERWGVPPERTWVVEPGTDPADVARGSGSTDLHMLCVATLTPRKGHDLLFRALARVPSRAWRLTCIGSLNRDAAMTAALRQVLETAGIADCVTLAGELQGDALDAAYDFADLFVLATHYEGYGMVVAEALARGLPVVATRTGAIEELVGRDAGTVVPPGDEAALASALTRLVCDPGERARLTAGARIRRTQLPTWRDASARMAAALDTMVSRG
jgi:glycosyltransferase involved in cell wall biosynthesis